MNKPEYNKFIVLKITDAMEYLGEHVVRNSLVPLLDKITAGRENHGKRENTYLVVNTDEPYADKIEDMILSEGQGWVKLPFRICTHVISVNDFGERCIIGCNSEQAAERRMEQIKNAKNDQEE